MSEDTDETKISFLESDNSNTVTDFEATFSDNITVSDDFEPLTQEDMEFEFSIEFSLDTEQTVVCHNCGEVNGVPEASLIEGFRFDPPCVFCGYPLGIVKNPSNWD